MRVQFPSFQCLGILLLVTFNSGEGIDLEILLNLAWLGLSKQTWGKGVHTQVTGGQPVKCFDPDFFTREEFQTKISLQDDKKEH